MSISAEIERFILEELTEGMGVAAIDPLENLLFTGLVDSHGLLALVGFLEERYEILVGDDDISPDNFECVASIEALVERKRTALDA